MNKVESFKTERILAERLKAKDIDDLCLMHQDSAVMEFVGGLRSKIETLEYLNINLEHWNKYNYGIWMLRDIHNSKFIGRGALRNILVEGKEEIELGYALMQKYWGKGLASEFATMAIEIAFSNIGIKEMVALTIPDNFASKRVIQKIGGVYERDVMHKDFLCNLYRVNRRKNKIARLKEPQTMRSLN